MTPRRSRGRRLVLVAVAALALVLAACSEVKNNGQNSLEPKGPQAQKIYDLFVPILIIAIVVGIAIIVATVFLAVKFRHKTGTNENPKQVHGNTRLEIGWTVLPALQLAIIAVPTVATIFGSSLAICRAIASFSSYWESCGVCFTAVVDCIS